MGTTPWAGRNYVLDHPNSPAVHVSWEDIRGENGFLDRLNALGLGTFRLPSEAEWEYACRAGTGTRYYWGNDPHLTMIGDHAWYRQASPSWILAQPRFAQPVGLKLPNPWGLYDMSGNVYEWCEDMYYRDYEVAPNDGSARVWPFAWRRVIRGGAFITGGHSCRSAARESASSEQSGSPFIGFRVVRDP